MTEIRYTVYEQCFEISADSLPDENDKDFIKNLEKAIIDDPRRELNIVIQVIDKDFAEKFFSQLESNYEKSDRNNELYIGNCYTLEEAEWNRRDEFISELNNDFAKWNCGCCTAQ